MNFLKVVRFFLAMTSPLMLLACVSTQQKTSIDADSIPADSRFFDIRQEFQQRVESGEFQSLAIGVIENGEIVWAEALGWADRERGVKATIHTPYGIASAGKSITATAAMKLVEQHKLNLDTNITDILGDEAITIYAGDRVPTVRELLNMTGGVPHGALTYRGLDHPNEAEVMRTRTIVALPAGASFHYSNFSIAIVDQVIERISGLSFPNYLAQEVFEPLGMTDSSIGLNPMTTPAVRYFEDGSPVGDIKPFPRSSRQMSASLSDLLNYAAFHLKAPLAKQIPILSSDSIDKLQTQISDYPGAHIALGIGNFDIGGGDSWIVTSGNDMGVQSNISFAHHAGVGVVVLTNSSGYQADELAIRLIDVIAPNFMDRVIPVMREFEGRSSPFVGTNDWTGGWSGSAETAGGEMGVSLNISSNGTVTIQLEDQTWETVEEATIRDGFFTGYFQGNLPLEESTIENQQIELGLQVYDDEIVGFILSNFSNERGRFQIPTFIRLIKK